VSANGSALLRFKMPAYYRSCGLSRDCRRIAWKPGEKVIVTASGYLEQAGTTTLVANPNE
jgi:hypothetical protein